MFQFQTLPPLSLYIHFPWCIRKCPYCDFNSHQLFQDLPEQAYIDALIQDLEQDLPRIWGRKIISIFMGGGTPSLFSPESIDKLISSIYSYLPWSLPIEITLEANPGAIDQKKLAEFRAAGINRLSLGIQSFDDQSLKALGRIHNAQQACSTIEAAHRAGFNNINLDLMFGLPDQSQDQALYDIKTAINFNPTHISHYQLTIEPNTYFHRYPPPLPIDESIYHWQELCQSSLENTDYEHYEISAFAKKDHQCQHNLNYWQFGDYLGIGAGAHGKITNGAENNITRLWKIKHPTAYLTQVGNQKHIGGQTTISPQDAAFEFMLNTLRLTQGFSNTLFLKHTGLPLSIIEKPLQQAEELEWIIRTPNYIQPTSKGSALLNELLQLFLP
ncbi:radical SAM family heme chaperone HemW [Candidatus Nitrosacidococcus sp. I8]|uniref:radical SAM family heme chaperone HemW n=1 Tax=Candidatus Nitrosacidococcus sp. I8 TaxID=2942908 RepID=UPI0022275860|nr:radical SAM family heme chaperone HemW [Candidatus Nitrosacidococcus sp. I8]CAH9019021.1 Heme chaperone HemW [Candidatus Nitrosacidococcus sp. I8]